MKILYHHRTASGDGQSVHIDEMIAAFRELGHEVRVVSPSDGVRSDKNKRMGSEVRWVRRLKLVLPKVIYELLEIGYSLVAYWKLSRVVKDFKPDLIYERYNLFLLAGVFFKMRHRIPLLLEVNAPLVDERLKHSGGIELKRLARWAEDYVWNRADYVLPVTHVLAHSMRERGVSNLKILVLPNGINKAHFMRAPGVDEAKMRLGLDGYLILGFAGFVREWHGVDRVLNWMASQDAPKNAYLLIVGDGPMRSKLEEQAVSLEIENRVLFTGVVDRTLVPMYVAAFDVALQPAVTAYASPLKLMEYLVLGKAIIAPSEPNLREILTDKANAVLFDPRQHLGFENSLTLICRDSRLRESIAREAIRTIDQKSLTWLENARRAVALVEEKKA